MIIARQVQQLTELLNKLQTIVFGSQYTTHESQYTQASIVQ